MSGLSNLGLSPVPSRGSIRLWHFVKNQLKEYDEPPSGVNELWERVQKVWEEIQAEVCQNLIVSMPSRIQAIVKAQGGYTNIEFVVCKIAAT